jgi:hypothetical protein
MGRSLDTFDGLQNTAPDFATVLQLFRENRDYKRTAFKSWEAAIEKASEEEAAYSRAFAKAIVNAEGSNAPAREAHARAATADERARRDVSRDMVAVWKERVRSLEGERAVINGLGDWAKRLEPGLGG